MRFFSYVVAHFTPNPFYGLCTLARYKPGIRVVSHLIANPSFGALIRCGFTVFD